MSFLPRLTALALVCLLPAACAAPTQYERGAYVVRPPPASTFNPAEDAPHTAGQPGYIDGRRVERSPNKRYVSPSAEPQMMAADGDDRRAVELMFSEPVPTKTPAGVEDAEYAKCWKDFQKLLDRERDAILKFSPEELRCMRYKVLSHCGARLIEGRTSAVGKQYDSTFEDLRASKQKTACGKRDEFITRRVVDYNNEFNRYGDDVLGWRPPPGGYRH